ncbi:glycoside hydrolase/deacetylase, partial [Fistulina hepatica ATCC 64428]
GTSIPPLEYITSNMPTGTSWSVTRTFSAGATPPVSGAPLLPTPFVYEAGDWPAQDKHPPTNSSEVEEWLKELDGWYIPDLSVTTGTCSGSPEAAANASERGWWTCGGYTRVTDITACPDKYTWGVSFDDGPGPYTQELIDYLDEKDITVTFFVVGSRVIERPSILVEEYMTGNEISVHTWSHPYLTTLSTEEIVAELGWTRKAITEVLGVTPTTMRPPYGDIDDRVRAISLAMGMVPIIWTRTSEGVSFDTNDWRIVSGEVTGEESYDTFENILGNVTELDTGFIVLEHDLWDQCVDIAIGYTLQSALNFDPQLTLKPIGNCTGKPETDMYLQSNTNTSFPYRNSTVTNDTSGDGSSNSTSSNSSSSSA